MAAKIDKKITSSVRWSPMQHPSEGLDSYWCLRRLELVANSVVEASIPTILLSCEIRKGVDYLHKWKTVQPKGLQQSQILYLHAKSGSDEGLWAETSSIYINSQHLCGLHK